MLKDHFLSTKLKLERAESKLNKIKKLWPNWSNNGGFQYIAEQNDEGQWLFIRLVMDDTKSCISVLVGELIYQLRSSLDTAVVAISRKINPECPTKDIYFPMPKSASNYASEAKKKLAYVSEEARQVIHDLKPYPEGNELLAGLNALRNNDAHIELTNVARHLLNMTSSIRPGSMFEEGCLGELTGIINAHRSKFPDQNEQIRIDVSSLTTDSREVLYLLNNNLIQPCSLVFENSGAFDGEFVLDKLDELTSYVKIVIEKLEVTIK